MNRNYIKKYRMNRNYNINEYYNGIKSYNYSDIIYNSNNINFIEEKHEADILLFLKKFFIIGV